MTIYFKSVHLPILTPQQVKMVLNVLDNSFILYVVTDILDQSIKYFSEQLSTQW